MVLQIIFSISKNLGRKLYRQYQSHAITNYVNTCKMKAKQFEFEAYTITQTAKKLGYKSTKTIYRLLNRNPSPLEEYIWYEFPNALGRKRIYLMLEPPNLVSLADKIKANIQVRKNNIIRKNR